MTPKESDILKMFPENAGEWLTDRAKKCGNCTHCVFHNVGNSRDGEAVRIWKCSQFPRCRKGIHIKINNEYLGCPLKRFNPEKW